MNEDITMNNTAFSANLAMLRKGRGLSQEQLAEKLGVSRQSVSKWESGICLPELATLDVLCGMFGCTLDTLLRGSVEQQAAGALQAYDAERNAFAKSVTAGVAAIMLGLTAASFLGATPLPKSMPMLAFLLGLIVGTMIFVASGMRHDAFERRHPAAEVQYPPEQREEFDRKAPGLIAGAVGAILAGVAVVVMVQPVLLARFDENLVSYAVGGVFFLILTCASCVLVWTGIQRDKYDAPAQKRRMQEDPAYARRERFSGKVYGVIWLLAVLVFLLWSFLADAWRISWVVFAAAGLLTAVAAVVMGQEEP